jgi:hypothetical protein
MEKAWNRSAKDNEEVYVNQRPIPEAALLDGDSVEMLRVWIASKSIHSSMKVGMYRETMNVSEERAWGQILADVARHVASALEQAYALDKTKSLEQIRESFNKELDKPTTLVKGSFVVHH